MPHYTWPSWPYTMLALDGLWPYTIGDPFNTFTLEAIRALVRFNCLSLSMKYGLTTITLIDCRRLTPVIHLHFSPLSFGSHEPVIFCKVVNLFLGLQKIKMLIFDLSFYGVKKD
jgi:hypothetical protein